MDPQGSILQGACRLWLTQNGIATLYVKTYVIP